MYGKYDGMGLGRLYWVEGIWVEEDGKYGRSRGRKCEGWPNPWGGLVSSCPAASDCVLGDGG